jgi:hypothetical protein
MTLVSLALAFATTLAVAQTSPATTSLDGKAVSRNAMIYITKDGRILDKDDMRAAMKIFVRQGKKLVVDRVIVDNEDY